MKNIDLFKEKMLEEKLPETVIENFEYYYDLLVKGEKGELLEKDIDPVDKIEDYSKLDIEYESIGRSNKNKSVVIKLNGGLGTSMGLSQAKSLLKVKNGLSFLDIIAKQTENDRIPLILMNSFNTREKSLELLSKYPSLFGELPIDFLQHKIPKINAENYLPADFGQNRELEWCPPGHGEIYTALVTSGLLQNLLDKEIEYAFISNSDNLGAVMDYRILGFFIKSNFPFLMEVAERTENDKKGGHLAKLKTGRLILRESAQCKEDDINFFQDINRHRFFNTNNIWINLKSLQKVLKTNNNVLELPMIVNTKPVDPKDPDSFKVYQLETAMGAAISVFEGADALLVPRSRFAPVKTTDDLLAVRSDYYVLTEDYRVIVNPKRKMKPLIVSLDNDYYKLVDDLNHRIPHPPSLLDCEKLIVKGDFLFGKNLKFKGIVELINESGNQKSLEQI